MHPSRSIFLLLAFVLLLGAMAPDADARRNCNCTLCQPGNLLAMCYWPGHGTVYCFDYWEFECNGPPFAGPVETEMLVCSDISAEAEALPEATASEDEAEEQEAGEHEADQTDSQSVAPVAVS